MAVLKASKAVFSLHIGDDFESNQSRGLNMSR